MVHFVEDAGAGAPEGDLAPVTPLFGARGAEYRAREKAKRGGDDLAASERRHPAGRGHGAKSPVQLLPSGGANADELDPVAEAEALRESAERMLVRKLSARQISVSEARTLLRQHGLDAESSDEMIEAFEERRYLDDVSLAEQLVTSGFERKAQGRQAIAQTLTKRGIPRDVADRALAVLPDDDAERALDFARVKAPSMMRLERDAALRRLHGQLARRGFPGMVAMTAARTALDELSGSHRTASSSVRFR